MKKKSTLFIILTAFISCMLMYPERVKADTLTNTDNYEYIVDNNQISISKYSGNEENVVIPEQINGMNVVEICNTAFLNNDVIESVYIPKTVKKIQSTAFSNCISLEEISVDSKNTFFCSDGGILYNKDKNTILSYPAAKQGSYTINSEVENIGENAFSNCIVSSVTIPEGIKSIGAQAFYNCDYITNVQIPDSVNYIGGGAFGACDDLVNIQISNQNQTYKSDNENVYSKDGSTIIAASSGVTGECNILDGVKIIGEYSFAGSSFSSVNMPNSVEEIKNFAFLCSDYLESIEIPSGVDKIGSYAFYLCDNLENITFHSGLKEIGNSAFSQCSSISNIKFTRANPPTISDNVFDNSINNVTITIPQVHKSRYEEIFSKYVSEQNSISYEYCDLENTNITVCTIDNIGNHEYTGKTISDISVNVWDGKWKLTEGTDYTIKFTNNKNVGEANITITGINAYSGNTYTSFYIEQKDISNLEFSSISNITYSGNSNRPSVKITDENIKYELKENIDYEVIYDENTIINVGTGCTTIIGKGSYTGSKKIYFNIVEKNIQNSVSICGIGSKIYTGKSIYQTFTVKYNGKTLINGTDYKAIYYYNVYPGKATIKFNFKGNYSGSKTITFDIKPTKVLNLINTYRTAKYIKLRWNAVKNISYYEVYRYDSSKKKYIYITRTTNCYYTNYNLSAGRKYIYKVRAVKKTSSGNVYGAFSDAKGFYTCPATTYISLSNYKKNVTVRWNKVSSASGYEIFAKKPGSSKYVLIKTCTSNSQKSFVHKNLIKGKIYYYKVRCYKVVSGKKIYGTFSNIKYIKVKGL